MGAAVVTATADGFAQSYAGLYAWALEHGLHGWKAASFPLMVDLLIVVGELGLFLLAIDAYSLQRKHFLTWFDFLLPLMIAVAGWTASLIFNVGHVQEQDFSFQATAAVPPIVSMLGLLVLLRTLHRYVSDRPSGERRGDAVGTSQQVLPALEETAAASAPASEATAFRFVSARDGFGRDGSPADDRTRESGAVRLVRLADWAPRAGAENAENGVRNGRNGRNAEKDSDRNAEPEAAAPVKDTGDPGHTETEAPDGDGSTEGPKPAATPEPTPEPTPESAPPSNGNGQSNVSTLTQRLATKERLLEELHEHQGNLAAALEAMEVEGLAYDVEEARRIRRNNWLPYVVYRLLAQHGGDVNQVSQALVDKRIDCEPTVLDELARSWQ